MERVAAGRAGCDERSWGLFPERATLERSVVGGHGVLLVVLVDQGEGGPRSCRDGRKCVVLNDDGRVGRADCWRCCWCRACCGRACRITRAARGDPEHQCCADGQALRPHANEYVGRCGNVESGARFFGSRPRRSQLSGARTTSPPPSDLLIPIATASDEGRALESETLIWLLRTPMNEPAPTREPSDRSSQTL